MYHIIGYQTNPITGETQYQILCDTIADLPTSPVSDNGYGGEIGQGSKAVVIADGSSYLADSNRQWIYQPNPNAWVNVYTKLEIDEMITEIYETIAYYHTTLVSDTGEITFYAVAGYIGTWSIFGNGSQTGTPSPDNIITPDMCGVRTANLAPPLTEWVNGYVASNGTIAKPSDDYKEKSSDYIPVKAGAAYTFSRENEFPGGTQAWRAIGWYAQDKTFISRVSDNYNTALSTNAPSNAAYCRLSYRTHGETTNPMLNAGSQALHYEPYGYKIPLTCAGQTVPVYLGQVSTVRRIKKLVLDGTETWYAASTTQGNTRFTKSGTIDANANADARSNIVCTHLAYNPDYNKVCVFITSDLYLSITMPGEMTVADFKSYLASQYAAGTPVTVWYVLATPTTAIVNEPLCKIGDYADELSSTDAGVAIPTVKGENTLTVDTILKPSRIEIQG